MAVDDIAAALAASAAFGGSESTAETPGDGQQSAEQPQAGADIPGDAGEPQASAEKHVVPGIGNTPTPPRRAEDKYEQLRRLAYPHHA